MHEQVHTQKQLITKRLESHKYELARTRAFLPATESKLFKTHMDELDKEITRLETGEATAAIGVYLSIISDDVNELQKRMRSPYKEAMQALVNAIRKTKTEIRFLGIE